MSKHPLDLPKDKKFTREELAEALRLSIIAELDAINLYLQLARSIEDERYRRVFEDIAREEKTHVGEFLVLLKTLDPEQVEELVKGEKEVIELTGLEIPSRLSSKENSGGSEDQVDAFTKEEWNYIVSSVREVTNANRILRKYLPATNMGRGTEAVVLEEFVVGREIKPTERKLIPLEELSVKFTISQYSIDYARKTGTKPDISAALGAATRLAFMEDSFIVEKLLGVKNALTMSISDWREPGKAVEEISRAVSTMINEGVTGPYILLVSPARYARLVAVHEKTGVMELERVKRLVKEVVPVKQLPDEKAVLVSSNPFFLDIVIGADTEIDYIGPENGNHLFRLWETIALRIRYPKAVMIMTQEKQQ
ncbi:MAG: family 1 encapsulin nanocompartment shell protein [Thermoprotei archaeon]